MTRLTLTLALLLVLAGCSTGSAPSPTPAERTVIVEQTAPTPEVVEKTVTHEVNRTVVVYQNRTVTVIKPSPTRYPSPTAYPSPTRRPSPTAYPSPTPRERTVVKTVIVTKTVEVTPEPTATPTPEPPEDSDINLQHQSEFADGTYTLDVLAQNWYDGPVDLKLGIILYDHHRRDTSVYSETRRNANLEGTGGQWRFTVTYDGVNASDVERAEVFVMEVERA